MDSILKKVTALFEQEKILPIKENWNSFMIRHNMPPSEQVKMDQLNYIRKQTGKKAGIYIYMQEDDVLYIGKAKELFNRLKSHYIESFAPVAGDTKDMRWHRFFSSYQGELCVYWKEFKSEDERQLIELILTHNEHPVFLSFR